MRTAGDDFWASGSCFSYFAPPENAGVICKVVIDLSRVLGEYVAHPDIREIHKGRKDQTRMRRIIVCTLTTALVRNLTSHTLSCQRLAGHWLVAVDVQPANKIVVSKTSCKMRREVCHLFHQMLHVPYQVLFSQRTK
jgi:hypothetical protein